MYPRHKCHRLIGTGTEAELLVKLWTSWIVLLQSSSDSLDGVRGLYCRIEVLSKKTTLYFCCKGHVVLLRTEGALRVSIDCYDAAWSGHLELEISIVRHRIELGKRSSSEQRVIATAKGDDIKDELLALEVVQRSEDDLQCD